MLMTFSLTYYLISATLAQNTPTVVCIPGQCLQGYSNTTIGAKLSAPGAVTDIHLLPGQYAINTNPQLVHDLLTSSSATLSPSPGFNGSLSNLPLNLELQPGLAIFAGPLYSGESGFSPLPNTPPVDNSSSTPLTAQSLGLSQNVWISTTTSGSSNVRTIFWESVPDIQELPPGTFGSLSLIDIESSACSPPCAGSGVCSASGTCQCASSGFTGASCESCASGFFGPKCQPCPKDCESCDEGITGSGRCLKPIVANAPSTCNCLNGVCGQQQQQCTCNSGFVTADNGTQCAKCAQGFFLTSTGDCKICQVGCTACNDGTGACASCKSGFTQDPNDPTKCNPPTSVTNTGAECPRGSFGDGSACSTCSPVCATCTGGTSNDCITCASGKLLSNGVCVDVNQDGICAGSNLIGDNIKQECDACDAKCTSCKISKFNGASTVKLAQCTGCLPGFVLSNGTCIDSCPSGTFVSPTDNLTCTACDSSCSTCTGLSTFCLSCANGQLASEGKCVSSCPQGTFTSSGSCLPCHPDCTTCTSGGGFNQCSSCPADRPVLSNGRCLPTCGKQAFFDTTRSECQSCDGSCSSCASAGPSGCLGCANEKEVLRGGTCVERVGCEGVVAGLGVCLSDLVVVTLNGTTTTTTTSPPLPTITGIDTPTTSGKRSELAWWEILLMALGCAFIFLVVVWLWRRRARRLRAEKTKRFVEGKVVRGDGWKWGWLESIWECGWRRKRVTAAAAERGESESVKLVKLVRVGSTQRGGEEDLVELIGSYNYPRTEEGEERRLSSSSSESMYSQVTGHKMMASSRQPYQERLVSRFSLSTLGAEELKKKGKEKARFWR